MSQQITLQLPEELYQRIREAAEASDRSIEDLLLESANMIFSSEIDLSTLDSLADYFNEQLWRVVLHRLSESQSLRLHILSDEQKQRRSAKQKRANSITCSIWSTACAAACESTASTKTTGKDVDSYLQVGV